jgi:hypothetical protein
LLLPFALHPKGDPTMKNTRGPNVQDHLATLAFPTPSGTAKLLAAWDDLSLESQIILLTEITEADPLTSFLPPHLNHFGNRFSNRLTKVVKKALDSPNSYIRYLAGRNLKSLPEGEEKKAIQTRIESDHDPMVRFCLLEEARTVLDFDPNTFFTLPQEARLAQIRSLQSCHRDVLSLIEHAAVHELKDGKITEVELFEILLDLMGSPAFRRLHSSDNTEAFLGLQQIYDIEGWWRLTTRLPEWMTYLLIEHLPAKHLFAVPRTKLRKVLLDTLSPYQLAHILRRPDIKLSAYRKELFFADNQHLAVSDEAVSHHFSLDYREFGEILSKSEGKRYELLSTLADYATELKPVLYRAIHDLLKDAKWDTGQVLNYGDKYPLIPHIKTFCRSAEQALGMLDYRLESCAPEYRKSELEDLALYHYAKELVPWKQGGDGQIPSSNLEFLTKSIVAGDTWATFMAFLKTWHEERFTHKKFYRDLPPIHEDRWTREEEQARRDAWEQQENLEKKERNHDEGIASWTRDLVAKEIDSLAKLFDSHILRFGEELRGIRKSMNGAFLIMVPLVTYLALRGCH